MATTELQSAVRRLRRRTNESVDFMNLTPVEMFHFERLDHGAISHSDRAGVLVAVTHLESGLIKALTSHFVTLADDERNALFDSGSGAPLSTFGAKITLAYALGIIGPMLKTDLQAIQAVRNFFAHHADHLDFTDEGLESIVQNLNFSRYADAARNPAFLPFIKGTKDRFMEACKWIFLEVALGPKMGPKRVADQEFYVHFDWTIS